MAGSETLSLVTVKAAPGLWASGGAGAGNGGSP